MHSHGNGMGMVLFRMIIDQTQAWIDYYLSVWLRSKIRNVDLITNIVRLLPGQKCWWETSIERKRLSGILEHGCSKRQGGIICWRAKKMWSRGGVHYWRVSLTYWVFRSSILYDPIVYFQVWVWCCNNDMLKKNVAINGNVKLTKVRRSRLKCGAMEYDEWLSAAGLAILPCLTYECVITREQQLDLCVCNQ